MVQILLLFILMVANILAGVLPAFLFSIIFLYDGMEILHLNLLIFVIKVMLFGVSLALSGYITLDIIFGFSVASQTKKLKSYKFSMRYSKICDAPFREVKSLFNIPQCRLLISPETKEEAYTIASISRMYICVSTGMLDSLRMRSQTDDEFQNTFKAILARQAVLLSGGDYLEQAIMQMNTSITGITKWVNSLFFRILGGVLGIVPYIGEYFAKICMFMNKIIVSFLSTINMVLFIFYKVFARISAGRDEGYYDSKAARIIGGDLVAKALSLTEKPDYRIFSTSANIHKRITAVNLIVKDEKPSPPSSSRKITVLFAITSIFASVGFLGYEIKIWRLYDFAKGFIHP